MENRKVIKKIIAGSLAAVLVAGVGVTAIATDGFQDFGNTDNIQMELPEENIGGAVIGESHGNGLKLTSAKIAAADYEEYGVSPLAEEAYTLTVTVTPSNATNQAMTWAVKFENSASAWATGKTATQYVRVTPSVIGDGGPGSESGTTATVECLQAFGEPIIIEVASVDNPEAMASCTVDYVKRVTSVSFYNYGGDTYSFGADSPVQFIPTPVYTDGTLTPTITYGPVKAEFTEEGLSDYGLTSYYKGEYELPSDIAVGGDVFHTTDFTYNDLFNCSASVFVGAFSNSATSDKPLRFFCTYSASYGDIGVVGSGTAECLFRVSVSQIKVAVEDIVLSDGSLIF